MLKKYQYFKLTIRFEQVYTLYANEDTVAGLRAAYNTTYIHIKKNGMNVVSSSQKQACLTG